MDSKTCIITGANSGLGYESAKSMASMGAEVVMVCRSREKAESARMKIIEETGNEQVSTEIADLSSQSDIRKLATQIQTKRKKIDVLVNNAGLILSKHLKTKDGIETIFAVNHLSYFYLTYLLLPMISDTADGRIVNVSSNNHFKAKMKFEDLQFSKNFSGLKAYGQSKLANILFTYSLHSKLQASGYSNVSVNALDPGLINTNIGNKETNWVYDLAWRFRKKQGMTAAEGAKTQIYLASSDEVKGVSGRFWKNCKDVRSSENSYKEQDAEKLWGISEELCGIEKFIS